MQCEKFEQRMHDLLDRRDPPESDRQLREHALVCEGCAEQLAAQESLFAGLKRAIPPELSPDFTERVLAQKERKASGWPFNRLVISLLALAAVLLVALVPAAWLWHLSRRNQEPAGRGTMAQDRSTDNDSRPSPKSESDGGDRDQHPSAHPPGSPPGGASEIAVVSPSADSPEGLASTDPPSLPFSGITGATEDTLAAVGRMTGPFRPVTNTVSGAINVLRRTLEASPVWPPDTSVDKKPQADTSRPQQTQDLA